MRSSYLVENRHIAIKHCRHGIFMYNRHDTFVGRGLDHYGEWCDFELQLLRQFIKPGDTVIDVGANIGTHTVAFANMVGPTGTVHAYEPQRRLFTMLAGNVALNALDWVVCHQEAVGDVMGEIHLPPLPPPDTFFNYSSVSLVNSLGQDNRTGDKVPLVALDSLDLSNCAVVKIDVEGMDPAVLMGATRLIERCQPVLYIEHNDAEYSKHIAEILAPLNYTAHWSIHPYYDEQNYYSNNVNIWQNVVWSSNLICFPKQLSVNFAAAQDFLGEGDDWRACLLRMKDSSERRL
jgi:FkbM family methyltransferase